MTCIEFKDYKQCFQYISKLGDGNCSSVSKIRHTKTKKNYALKYTKLDNPSKLVIAFQQIEVIRAIDHPTAIQVYFYFVKSSPNQQFVLQNIQLGFVMEIGDRSIQQDIFIRKKKQVYYSDHQIRNIFVTLIEFFAHMQRKGYMHRDIKPANILIMPHSQATDTQSQSTSPLSSETEVYKVCDFGFAIKNHEFSDKNIAGTASYASPKIHSKFKNSQVFVKGNNFKDDVFSLGITMIQICSLQSTENIPPQRLMPKINSKYGLKIAALLQLMIQFQQTKRPDFIKLEQMLPKYLEPVQIEATMPKVNRFNQSSQTYEEDFIAWSQGVQQNQCLEKRIKNNRITNGGFDKKIGQFDIVQCELNQTTVESESGRNPLHDKQYKDKRIIKINEKSKIVSKNDNREEIDKITKQTYTPRTDKQVQNKQKIQQLSIVNKKNTQPVTQPCSPTNDRVRTKRRSKQVMNASQNASMGTNVNVNLNENKNVSRGRGWFENMKKISKDFFTVKNKCDSQVDDNQKQEVYSDTNSYQFDDFVVNNDKNGHPNQVSHKLTDSNVKFLYGFPANSISQLQFVELSKNYGDHGESSRTLLVACNRSIFKIEQNKQNTKTQQLTLPVQLQQISYMKHSKPQNKLIICSTTPTCTTIIKIPLYLILQANINKISKKDMYIETSPSQCIAFNLSFPFQKFVKIYSNGNVVQDDRFILQTCGSIRDGGQDQGLVNRRYGRVAFLGKMANVVYTCTCNGLIRKYKLKEHYINGPNSLTTFYDARCTIIQMKIQITNPKTQTMDAIHENDNKSRQNEIMIIVVTSTGCLIYLNSNLEVLEINNISKNCLRACHIDFELGRGKRVLAVDGLGNFYNQLGFICYKSGIENITNICVGGKDQKIIVACEDGSIYGIKMQVFVGEKQKNYGSLHQIDLRRGIDPIIKTENNMKNIFYCNKYGK